MASDRRIGSEEIKSVNNAQPNFPQSNRVHGVWLTLDKLGAIGAIITAMASPCCFPLLATAAGLLGLGSFPFLRNHSSFLIQTMTVLAFVGQIAAYRQNRIRAPLFIS